MTIAARTRRVTTIAAACAFALGLATLSLGALGAAPAQAQTASPPSASWFFGGSHSCSRVPRLVDINSSVDALALNTGCTFGQGGWVVVRFSNGISHDLIMQNDGNFVDYVSNGKTWASNTKRTMGFRAILQGDGNLVVYDAAGRALWASHTNGHPGDFLAIQSDGNLVIYESGNLTALWASHTNS